MIQFNNIFKNKKALVTGHTGFKGSWLSLWLQALGADVYGIALDPESYPNHWEMLHLSLSDYRMDIRDAKTIIELVQQIQPEIIFHLAAQPLVRRSYREPLANWATNIMGTAHILEACRVTESVKAVVAITTDKVYENMEWCWGYRENERLGGHDPYSASKAACEILIESYRKSFFNKDSALLLASTRAGNVIGGGDWSEDRLIPDIIRALEENRSLEIRSPGSTRPWQHVLDCLSGYLSLGQKLLQGKAEFAEAWNFGPENERNRTVAEILSRMKSLLPELKWHTSASDHPHESGLLFLDLSKACAHLSWKPVWGFDTAVQKTAEWYSHYLTNKKAYSEEQLASYLKAALRQQVAWIKS